MWEQAVLSEWSHGSLHILAHTSASRAPRNLPLQNKKLKLQSGQPNGGSPCEMLKIHKKPVDLGHWTTLVNCRWYSIYLVYTCNYPVVNKTEALGQGKMSKTLFLCSQVFA